MIKVKYTGGYNDDGTPKRAIGADDRQVIDLEPDFQGGFNTRVAYKDFDLSVIGAFKSGGVLISTLYSSTGYLNIMTGRRNNVKIDYWTPENTNAKYPKPGGVEQSDNPKYGSTMGYFDASYLKIRTITLGYNAPKEWLKRFGVNNLRLYATVQNPFVFFSPYHDESGGALQGGVVILPVEVAQVRIHGGQSSHHPRFGLEEGRVVSAARLLIQYIRASCKEQRAERCSHNCLYIIRFHIDTGFRMTH